MSVAAASAELLLNLKDARKLLREDDSLLRQIFLSVLKHHHPKLASKIDVIYALSQAWCEGGSEEEFDALEHYLQQLKPEETILVRARRPRCRNAASCAANRVTCREGAGALRPDRQRRARIRSRARREPRARLLRRRAGNCLQAVGRPSAAVRPCAVPAPSCRP